MTTTLETKAGDPGEPLAELTMRIKNTLAAMAIAAKDVVRRAMAAGDDLVKAKAQVEHGKWGEWLKTNFAMTERTAQRYMELANGRTKLEKELAKSDIMSDLTGLTINKALGLIKDQSDQSESASPPASSDSDEDEGDVVSSVNASDEYDEVEEELIDKLEALPLAEAEAAVKETIKRLNKALTSKRKAVETEKTQEQKQAA
jgi:Protein of unknown function (DUF3102)